ncbi:hypothetical protein BV22DRAFT_1122174 [Leucogyrophana mollusca]|uniref:Uncharacterized protein n=1 Tax=Leucogyrophana mollusca TaxID=85980 RepID=A0ACB8B7J8_9AGAM|nr:hypothetical protein BV22DRAFT_1122174 [Leucogyrophana mollusca]
MLFFDLHHHEPLGLTVDPGLAVHHTFSGFLDPQSTQRTSQLVFWCQMFLMESLQTQRQRLAPGWQVATTRITPTIFLLALALVALLEETQFIMLAGSKSKRSDVFNRVLVRYWVLVPRGASRAKVILKYCAFMVLMVTGAVLTGEDIEHKPSFWDRCRTEGEGNTCEGGEDGDLSDPGEHTAAGGCQ